MTDKSDKSKDHSWGELPTLGQAFRYLTDPEHCPMCSSDNIQAGQWDGDSMEQDVECLDCHYQWFDEYKLVGITSYDGSAELYLDDILNVADTGDLAEYVEEADV